MNPWENEGPDLAGRVYSLMRELIPDPEDEYGEMEAELRDAILCADDEALIRARLEVDRRSEFYDRMRAMWREVALATDPRDRPALQKAARAIRQAVEEEWEIRSSPPRDEPSTEG